MSWLGLEGKVAIVTGGALGIGRAVCEGLAVAERAALSRMSISRARAGAGCGTCTAIRRRSPCRELRRGEQGSVDAMVAEVVAKFGAVDILVNNGHTHPAPSGGCCREGRVERSNMGQDGCHKHERNVSVRAGGRPCHDCNGNTRCDCECRGVSLEGSQGAERLCRHESGAVFAHPFMGRKKSLRLAKYPCRGTCAWHSGSDRAAVAGI